MCRHIGSGSNSVSPKVLRKVFRMSTGKVQLWTGNINDDIEDTDN